MTQETKFFLESVTEEVVKAINKFPWPNPNLAALTEEVGELAQAMLQKKSHEEIYKEAVQVAAMAMRCAIEGDPQFILKVQNEASLRVLFEDVENMDPVFYDELERHTDKDVAKYGQYINPRVECAWQGFLRAAKIFGGKP
jgi:NTP pyrophosphatase (non-canonical NTP hydrolase)